MYMYRGFRNLEDFELCFETSTTATVGPCGAIGSTFDSGPEGPEFKPRRVTDLVPLGKALYMTFLYRLLKSSAN